MPEATIGSIIRISQRYCGSRFSFSFYGWLNIRPVYSCNCQLERTCMPSGIASNYIRANYAQTFLIGSVMMTASPNLEPVLSLRFQPQANYLFVLILSPFAVDFYFRQMDSGPTIIPRRVTQTAQKLGWIVEIEINKKSQFTFAQRQWIIRICFQMAE